jgi:hypothetical protein
MAGPDLLERIDAILTAVLELKRIHSGEGDIGAGGGTIEMALAFSQRREIFPCQGAPRFFSIFFDLVLDPHNYRRHFRLAGNLGSNSRSLLKLGRDFSQSLSKIRMVAAMTAILSGSRSARSAWADAPTSNSAAAAMINLRLIFRLPVSAKRGLRSGFLRRSVRPASPVSLPRAASAASAASTTWGLLFAGPRCFCVLLVAWPKAKITLRQAARIIHKSWEG